MKEDNKNNDPIQEYGTHKNQKDKKGITFREYIDGVIHYIDTSPRAKRRIRSLEILLAIYVLMLGITVQKMYRQNVRETMQEQSNTSQNIIVQYPKETETGNKDKSTEQEKIDSQKEAMEKKESSYYDNLKLDVGDLYNMHDEEGKFVVFCIVLSGEEPRVGETFHVESKTSSDFVYEVTVYKVEHAKDSFGKDFLRVYFEGAMTEQLAFTPEIQRVK